MYQLYTPSLFPMPYTVACTSSIRCCMYQGTLEMSQTSWKVAAWFRLLIYGWWWLSVFLEWCAREMCCFVTQWWLYRYVVTTMIMLSHIRRPNRGRSKHKFEDTRYRIVPNIGSKIREKLYSWNKRDYRCFHSENEVHSSKSPIKKMKALGLHSHIHHWMKVFSLWYYKSPKSGLDHQMEDTHRTFNHWTHFHY
jgi:hypothetical protein